MKKKSFFLTALVTLSLATATIAQTVPNYVPTNGLVGWWPFNGNANDESGNNNNGTVNGATLTSDRFGNSNKAYSFDGIDDYISVNNLNCNTDWSINFWFVSNNQGSFTQQYLIGNGKNNFGCGIGISGGNSPAINGKKIFSYDGVTPLLNILDGGSYNEQNNFNITIISQSSIQYIYINSILVNLGQLNQIIIDSCSFGKRMDNLFYYRGVLDDIGIWNRALTQQEITDLYNANICYQTVTVTDTLIINTNLVGFNPVTYQNTIKIYPNPTNDHITINYGNFATLSGYQLKIENSLGQQVFQTSINQQSSYLNLSTWGGNGIYFVRIIDPQGNTVDIRKIVLQ